MEQGLTERERAKRVICALIEVAGGTLEGKMRLFKAFYYAHLKFVEQNVGSVLTGYPIVHMPKGPGIDEHACILEELQEEERIDVGIIHHGEGVHEFVYTVLRPSQIEKDTPEYTAIRQGYEKVEGQSTSQMSAESHNRSWDETVSGQEQNIAVDLMGDKEYRRFKQNLIHVRQLFDAASFNEL